MPTKHVRPSRGIKIFTISLVAGSVVLIGMAVTAGVFALTLDVPSINTFKDREIAESTKIYDRTGEIPLFEIYGEEKRTVVPFEEIPRHLKNATIAIEDSRFYSHYGISVWGIFRAFITDLRQGRFLVQGGSTITQQLVKNTLLTPERTLTRKVKEAVLALKMETVYSKDEILNLYLNEIPYGSNAYGVEAAAQTFFGKHVKDIDLAESAYIAAITKKPTRYSPYGNHVDELTTRKDLVLTRMSELNYITPEEAEVAKKQKVEFIPYREQGIKAPHFVMYVIEQLNEAYGEEFVQKNGLKVVTSLDWKLQQDAEDVITAHAENLEKNFNAHNSGLIALDPKTGEILAMVGSRDYFDIKNEGNFNVTLARRQPGSAFKPIVYATAFKKGYTPDTVLFDVETEFAAQGADSYKPQNYDALFRGPISLRNALAQSINIPAVKLLYLVGIKDALATAQELGIATLTDPRRYGLSLVLGGGEVRMLELAGAYGTFANEGIRNDPVSVLRVEKGDGTILEEHTPSPKQVLDMEVARAVSDVLSDNEARTPAFGSNSALHFPDRSVAVKTGTTNDYKDAWIIGYTPSIVAGVWAGNNNSASMEKKVAGFIVAPIWRDFMDRALAEKPNEPFTEPSLPVPEKPILRGLWQGGAAYKIDRVSGKLASEFTPPEFIEERVTGDIHTILHWVDKNDPTGPAPSNPARDSQYANWETGVQKWIREHGITPSNNPIPQDYDDVHTSQNRPIINIEQPTQSETISHNGVIPFKLRIDSKYPLKQVDYFADEVLIGSSKENFGNFNLDASLIPESEEPVTIRIRAYDQVGNTGEKEISLTFSAA